MTNSASGKVAISLIPPIKTKQGKGSSIIQTELATKKSKEIKTFKVEVALAGVRGNEIYYTVVSQHGGEMFEPELRVFNIASKKDLSIAKNASFVELGNTKIYYMNFLMELNPTKLYTVGYNYKSPKMISKNAVNYALIGGKLYIAESKIVNPDDEFDMNNLKNETLFVCNEDGSGKKALTGTINGYIYDRELPLGLRGLCCRGPRPLTSCLSFLRKRSMASLPSS